MIDCCPYCGQNDKGFYCNVTEKYELLFDFKNPEENHRSECSLPVYGSYKCWACDKTINRKLIEE